jgi:hypothetical protein
MRMLISRLGGVILTGTLCAGMVVTAQNKGAAKQKAPTAKQTAGLVKKESDAEVNRKLIVFYLHGTARCRTCMKFEALTKEVMDVSFADEVKKGWVKFRVVNVDDKENEHYVQDYQLYSKSVILSDTAGGKQTRWKNLEQIWEKVRDEDAYKQYIRDEVASYLKAG